MYIAAFILLISYIFIATDKVPKSTIAILGAAITLVCGLIPNEKVFSYIDFGVIILLISMMIIVHITARSGVFNWLSFKILKLTRGNTKLILVALATLTAVLSAFLDNVTTVLLVVPVTFTIARELKIDPVPLLITEILASNIGGTATLIGDPPNIIIGSAAGFTFMDFIRELSPVVVVTFVVSIAIILFMMRKDLKSSPEAQESIRRLDFSGLIKDHALMIRSLIVLGLVLVGFILHSFLHIESYVIAMLGAGVLLLFEKKSDIFHEVEWSTIFFFVGLFIIIGGVIETGGIKLVSSYLIDITHGDSKLASMLILWSSGFLSAIVDNIPYTVTMIPLIKELHNVMDIYPLWWSLSLGACFGGNATIIGAAANVIVSEISDAAGHSFSFRQFFKYGFVITVVSLGISSAYLYLRFFM